MTVNEDVRPAPSFAHPLFLGALAALAFNDHVLKATGAVPAISGKLSDVAGLLVAPLVLAWLLRVRSRRGFALAHVAVGLGFAAIQVPAIAAGLEQLAPVRIWPDATDLWALPALLVSYRVLGRTEGRPRHAVGLIALALCTATSPGVETPPPRYPFPPAGVLETDVFIRNQLSADLIVGVRRLEDAIEVDCDGLLQTPETMLDNGDFVDDERQWTVAARDGVPLWDRRGGAMTRECYAVILTAHGARWLITWRHGAPALREIPVRLEPHEAVEAGAMRISNDPQRPPSVPPGVTVRPWRE